MTYAHCVRRSSQHAIHGSPDRHRPADRPRASRGTLAGAWFLGDEDCAISVITVSELLHGARRATGSRRRRRLAFVEHLLADLRHIPVTEAVARVHADIWSDLADKGEIIGAHDLWIAATAMAHGFGLAMRNTAEFRRVDDLRLVTPSDDSLSAL